MRGITQPVSLGWAMFPRTWLVEFPYSKAHDETVNEKETLEAVGNLIQTARMEMQISQIQFADRVGVNVQTLRTMERGGRITQSVAQAKVEKGLGWRTGAIKDVWEDREHLTPEAVTLEEMRRGAGEASFQDLETSRNESPVTKASHLSDEELLAELSYRFRNYKYAAEREA